MISIFLLLTLDAAAQETEGGQNVVPIQAGPVEEQPGEVAEETAANPVPPAPELSAETSGAYVGRYAPERSPGSIWVETEALQLLGLEGNARQVGDLITVRISERTATEVGAETKSGRSSTVGAGINGLFGLETSVLSANPNMGQSIAMDVTSDRDFEGTGSTSRGSVASATITCEVVQVLPGGNLRISGLKQVRVNREIQYVVLRGVVRPQDIQMDNTVSSDLIARAEIEISGQGAVADPQKPGLGTRILDHAWPF